MRSRYAGGIRCPSCHCCRSKVTRTTRKRRYIVRERICNNCGAPFRTREMRDDPPDEDDQAAPQDNAAEALKDDTPPDDWE